MKILAIESSCDETAAAVTEERKVLSSIVSTQIAEHRIYGGVVPDTIEELVKLPGVGRKTANLIVGDLYGKPAFVCDTHVIRLTNLLGLADTKDAAKVEKQTLKV